MQSSSGWGSQRLSTTFWGILLVDGLPAVTRLNDQHAFLSVAPDSTLAVGDIIAFGISHPCTCLDRWRVILGLDAEGIVTRALPTQFG